MELVKLYAILMRRKWLLLQSLVFFLFAGFASANLLPKQFAASTKMIVSSSDATMSVLSDLGLQELATGLSGASDEIQNHIALLSSKPVLEELIWKLQLRNDSGVLLPPDKLLIPGIDARFRAPPQISVQQHQGTDIVTVGTTADDPELARLMADTLASIYIEDTEDRARRETREAHLFVEERLTLVRAEFDAAMIDIADAQEREQIVDLEAEVKSAVSRLSDLLLAGEENAARIQELRAQAREIRRFQAQENVGFLAPGTVAENPDIRGYRERLAELRQERDALLQEKTEAHPDVVLVDSLIASVEGQLGLALEEQHALQPSLVKIQTELSGLQERGVELASSINRTTERFALYPEKMRTLSQLELAATAAEEVYRSLQDQSYQIAIAEAMTVSPLQVVEPAARPERHMFPKLLPCLFYGLMLGLLFGVCLMAVFEYVDDSIKSAEELREITHAPLLGIIPRYRTSRGQHIADFSPTHPVVEGFRTLRSALDYATLDSPTRILAITSALPGEGKSTVAANVAISRAREGKKVLIVDCDLRRPSQHQFWEKVHSDAGVTTVLLGRRTLAEAVQPSGVEHLSVLTTGPTPPDPGRLVESLKLRQLLLEAAKTYDLVLVDTPPVLLVNDALVLGRIVDHLLMIVEANNTPRRAIAEALAQVKAGGLEPVGVVLNKVSARTGYYGGYRKAYRSYYGEQEKKREEGGVA